MVIAFIRTIILYLLIIAGVRLMGKRQVGELEPSELVLALLIAALLHKQGCEPVKIGKLRLGNIVIQRQEQLSVHDLGGELEQGFFFLPGP